MRARALCRVLLACAVLTGCERVKISRGDTPEQPPPEIIAMGLNPAFREIVVADPIERDRLCRAAGVSAHDDWNAHLIRACVDMLNKQVLYPPDAPEELKRHERAHTQFYEHDAAGHGFHPMRTLATAPIRLETATTQPPPPMSGLYELGAQQRR